MLKHLKKEKKIDILMNRIGELKREVLSQQKAIYQLNRAMDHALLQIAKTYGTDGKLVFPVGNLDELAEWEVHTVKEGENYAVTVSSKTEKQ